MTEDDVVDSGFAHIDVDIDDMAKKLCELYISKNLSPASASLFQDLVAEGEPTEYAVYRAVVNEQIIDLLLDLT